MRLCNASNPAQGFALNTTSGYVEHLDLGHGSMKPSEACLRVSSTSLKETPVLGPFVSAATCYDGGSGVSRAGARFNLTESGELVSAMGVTAWRQRKDWSKAPPPPGVAGPCLVPRRGWPNKYGPMQLWSKPQPGGTAAVFIQVRFALIKNDECCIETDGVCIKNDEFNSVHGLDVGQQQCL